MLRRPRDKDTMKDVLDALFKHILCQNTKSGDVCGDVLDVIRLGTLAEMIGVSLDNMSIYHLAWSWSCQTPLSITKNEFMRGMIALSTSSGSLTKCHLHTPVTAQRPEFEPLLAALQNHVKKVDLVLHNDAKQFKQFYRFIFAWVQSSETIEKFVGEAGISIDSAVELWRMLFPEYKRFEQLDSWITFCTTKELFRRKAISKDLWEQLLEFTSLECYDTYDVSDAWPSAIDDFVEYFRSTHAGSALKV